MRAKIQEFVSQKKVKTESGYYLKGDKSIFDKIPWASGRLFRGKQWNVLPCVAKRDTATGPDVV